MLDVIAPLLSDPGFAIGYLGGTSKRYPAVTSGQTTS